MWLVSQMRSANLQRPPFCSLVLPSHYQGGEEAAPKHYFPLRFGRRQQSYFRLRRDFFVTDAFRAVTALSIAKSSIFRPCLTRAVSQRGRAPRPAQVSPPGPRYFGATLRPFIGLT